MSREKSLKRNHHKQSEFCYSRPNYREARWERAVKVYTINQESKYLLVQGIPSVGVSKELVELFALYGAVEEYRILDEYPSEEFTETYWIKFQKIQSARFAKKKLDMRSFFGGILHVSYAPEYESIDDTRSKLRERQKQVYYKCKELYSKKENNTNQKPVSQPMNEQRDIDLNKQSTSNQENASCSSNDLPLPVEHNKTVPSENVIPPLPLPPTHLPFYLYNAPPPPPPEYPKIPTKHATLPADIQNISRIEMEAQASECQQEHSNKCENDLPMDNMSVKQFADSTIYGMSGDYAKIESQCSWNEKPARVKQQNCNVRNRTVKQIVWNMPPTVTRPSSSQLQMSPPGAWDPLAESRKDSKSLTGDKNLDELALTIRNRLKKVTEPEKYAIETTTNVAQGPFVGATGPILKKKARKRI